MVLLYQSSTLPANIEICNVTANGAEGFINWVPTATSAWNMDQSVPAGTCVSLGAIYGLQMEANHQHSQWKSEYKQFSPACSKPL